MPSIALDALHGSARPLDRATRNFMEPRFGHDFSRVRVHADGPAADAARAVHARAYTHGSDVVFGAGEYAPETPRGRRLLAHELTHVVQQGAAPPASTREAGATPPSRVRSIPSPMPISRAPEGMLAFETTEADALAGVESQLAKPDPIAGVGDPSGAFAILAGVGDDQALLNVLESVEAKHQLDQLRSVGPAGQPIDEAHRLTAAMQAVYFAHAPLDTVGQGEMQTFVTLVGGFSEARRILFLRHVLDGRGMDREKVSATLEGLTALDDQQAGTPVPDASVQAVAAGVAPAPWAPPGGQPIPFYIGNAAHIAIAASYTAAHAGDQVFTNFSPISSIFTAWQALGKAVKPGTSPADAALKPDIANLTRIHLYEIKPSASAALAVAEATMYQAIFAAAGIPMTLGPAGEPGTSGVVPAPAGVFIFESPEPGAITYQYRRSKVVPVPVPVPEKKEEPSKVRFNSPKFALKPLTNAELQQLGLAVATVAAVGIVLILIAILLSPVGV